MPAPLPSDVTDLLVSLLEPAAAPDAPARQAAMDRLLPLLYEDLRRVAHRVRRGEAPDHTLNTTALVHEAYLKLAAHQPQGLASRHHFLAIAARVMRQVLVDYARTRSRAKRGGGQRPVGLDEAHEVVVLSDAARDEILALDSALQALDALDPRQGQIVECRYFGGLTVEETAEALGISAPTVKREWRTARLFLLHHLAGQEEA